MKNNRKCIELSKKINDLQSKINKREGPFNDGSKLMVPLVDETTEKNMTKLQKLEEEYKSLCK